MRKLFYCDKETWCIGSNTAPHVALGPRTLNTNFLMDNFQVKVQYEQSYLNLCTTGTNVCKKVHSDAQKDRNIYLL
jgi:hypothetical protein